MLTSSVANRFLSSYMCSEILPRGPLQPIINSDPLYRAIVEELMSVALTRRSSSMGTRRSFCMLSVINRYIAHADLPADERLTLSIAVERCRRAMRELRSLGTTGSEEERPPMWEVIATEMMRRFFPPRMDRSLRYQYMTSCFMKADHLLQELKPYSWSWHKRISGSDEAAEKSMYEALMRVMEGYQCASEALFEDLIADHEEGTKCRVVADLVKGNLDRIVNLTGLKWKEFNALFMSIRDELQKQLPRLRSHDGASKYRLKTKRGREHTRMSLRFRLLITLWW